MLFNDEDTYSKQIDEIENLFKLGGFPHKIPKKGKATRTFTQSIEMVQDIKDGTFLNKWELDMDWVKKITRGNEKALLDKIAEEPMNWLNVALTCKSQAETDKSLFPLNKDTLKSLSFPEFLCNSYRGTSWFIYFLMRGNETNTEAEQQEWVEKVPKSFYTALKELGLSKWEKHLPSFAIGVVKLHEWYKENRKNTERWMRIRTPVEFWTDYLDYISNMVQTAPGKNYFMPDGNVHKAWRRSRNV